MAVSSTCRCPRPAVSVSAVSAVSAVMIDSRRSPSEVVHSIGWNPNPALKCAAVGGLVFSGGTSTSCGVDVQHHRSRPRRVAAALTWASDVSAVVSSAAVMSPVSGSAQMWAL